MTPKEMRVPARRRSEFAAKFEAHYNGMGGLLKDVSPSDVNIMSKLTWYRLLPPASELPNDEDEHTHVECLYGNIGSVKLPSWMRVKKNWRTVDLWSFQHARLMLPEDESSNKKRRTNEWYFSEFFENNASYKETLDKVVKFVDSGDAESEATTTCPSPSSTRRAASSTSLSSSPAAEAPPSEAAPVDWDAAGIQKKLEKIRAALCVRE